MDAPVIQIFIQWWQGLAPTDQYTLAVYLAQQLDAARASGATSHDVLFRGVHQGAPPPARPVQLTGPICPTCHQPWPM